MIFILKLIDNLYQIGPNANVELLNMLKPIENQRWVKSLNGYSTVLCYETRFNRFDADPIAFKYPTRCLKNILYCFTSR